MGVFWRNLIPSKLLIKPAFVKVYFWPLIEDIALDTRWIMKFGKGPHERLSRRFHTGSEIVPGVGLGWRKWGGAHFYWVLFDSYLILWHLQLYFTDQVPLTFFSPANQNCFCFDHLKQASKSQGAAEMGSAKMWMEPACLNLLSTRQRQIKFLPMLFLP